MTPEIKNDKYNEKLTFIGFLFAAYHAVLACYNEPIPVLLGFVLVVGLVVLDKLLSNNITKIVFPRSCICLCYFVTFCYFSRIWAWNVTLVAEQTEFLIAQLILVIAMVNYFVKINSVKACLYAIVISGLALSIYVIIDNGGLASFYEAATEVGNRMTAGDRNENSVGTIGAFSVVVLFYYGMFKEKKSCYLLSVIPFITSVASGSRKSILLLAVGIIALGFLKQKDRKGAEKYIKSVLFIIIAIIGFNFVMSLDIMATVKDRMEQLIGTLTGSTYHKEGSTVTRKKMIEVGVQQFKKTPFLGIGMANSPVLNNIYIGRATYSHNDFIEHLVNGGMASLLMYYGTVLYLAIKHIKLMKVNKNPEIIISFTTLLMYVVMSGASVTYYGSMMTYLYFTLWISEVAICEREQKEKHFKESSEKDCVAGIS